MPQLMASPMGGQDEYIVLFEQGLFATPVRILSGYDAQMLAIHLLSSLPQDRKEYVINHVKPKEIKS